MKKYNFYAGPAILPPEVIEQAANAVKELDQSGLSLIEISHRSQPFVEIMERARSLVKELLALPETHEVLFLQGGASLGFVMVPMNFMKATNGRAGYLETGKWAQNAIKEAKRFGEVVILASSADKQFSYTPQDYPIPEDLDYVHVTSNNTIYGTQMFSFPETTVPLIADMSSDIMSRQIDASRFALIYAGAQKNLGPAGTTLYIVNKEALGRTGRDIPTMLDLQVHIEKDSMFNTPPVFAIYGTLLTLEWIKKNGGVAEMERRNREKARLLYEEIDRNALFVGIAEPSSRSLMNVTFRLTKPELEPEFDRMWMDAGIVGLKGHRSVGGYRASIYNAMPLEGVKVLVNVLQEFERRYG
jgi:phosphoserine aminotransferase